MDLKEVRIQNTKETNSHIKQDLYVIYGPRSLENTHFEKLTFIQKLLFFKGKECSLIKL